MPMMASTYAPPGSTVTACAWSARRPSGRAGSARLRDAIRLRPGVGRAAGGRRPAWGPAGRLTGAPSQPRTVYSILEGKSLASMLPILEAFKPVAAESRSVTVADRIVEAVATGHLLPGQRLVEQDDRGSLRGFASASARGHEDVVCSRHPGGRATPWHARGSDRRGLGRIRAPGATGARAARVSRCGTGPSREAGAGAPAPRPDRRHGAKRRPRTGCRCSGLTSRSIAA